MHNKPPEKYQQKADFSQTKLKILVLNDAHVDFLYKEGANAICTGSTCCRDKEDLSQKSSNFVAAGKWGHVGRCGLPIRTLDNFLNLTLEKIKPDLIFWLGDTPDHNLWGHTQETHLEGIDYITKRLLEKYNKTGGVYAVLGNHEGLPCNHFNYETREQQWILDKPAKLWEKWLTPESVLEFKKYGWYSQVHPYTNLRIIALSPFVMDYYNTALYPNLTNSMRNVFFKNKRK